MAQLIALGFSARAASEMVTGALQRAKRSKFPPISAARIARDWPRMRGQYNPPFGRIDGKEFGALDMHAAEARAMTAAECKTYLRQFDGPAPPKPKRKRDK